MIKIKDSLFSEDEIKYIQPFCSDFYGYCIRVTFKNEDELLIDFNTKKERDKELISLLRKNK